MHPRRLINCLSCIRDSSDNPTVRVNPFILSRGPTNSLAALQFSLPGLTLPGWKATRCADVTLVFTVPLETNYLRMYWTDLHPIFRICSVHVWVGMVFPSLFSQSLKGRCYANRFLVRIGETWHPPPSFSALAYHNGWKDCNVNVHVTTDDEPSSSDKNLTNSGPVTREFCRGVCAGPATRCASPRISS